MEIVNQTIRIIDYENNAVYKRDTPDEFSDYVKQLITYINSNTSIREYCTRSVNTEVISCILDIIHNQLDEEFVTEKIDAIAVVEIVSISPMYQSLFDVIQRILKLMQNVFVRKII